MGSLPKEKKHIFTSSGNSWKPQTPSLEPLGVVSPGGLSGSIRPGCRQRPQLVALPSSCVSLRAQESYARRASMLSLQALAGGLCLPPSPPPLPDLCLHPVIISPDACPSLSSESCCHQGALFAMVAVPLQALRTTLLTIPPQRVPWPRLGQLSTLLGKASGQDSG